MTMMSEGQFRILGNLVCIDKMVDQVKWKNQLCNQNFKGQQEHEIRNPNSKYANTAIVEEAIVSEPEMFEEVS